MRPWLMAMSTLLFLLFFLNLFAFGQMARIKHWMFNNITFSSFILWNAIPSSQLGPFHSFGSRQTLIHRAWKIFSSRRKSQAKKHFCSEKEESVRTFDRSFLLPYSYLQALLWQHTPWSSSHIEKNFLFILKTKRFAKMLGYQFAIAKAIYWFITSLACTAFHYALPSICQFSGAGFSSPLH